MGNVIVGSGMFVPDNVVTNHDLARNIGSYGNTTAATLPILYHELRAAGRVGPGTMICFAAFGAGAHYGAALYREPADR